MHILTEVYEHLAVTLPHVLWHSEDAGHVVVQERVLLLQKDKNNPETPMICLTQVYPRWIIRTNIYEFEVDLDCVSLIFFVSHTLRLNQCRTN